MGVLKGALAFVIWAVIFTVWLMGVEATMAWIARWTS